MPLHFTHLPAAVPGCESDSASKGFTSIGSKEQYTCDYLLTIYRSDPPHFLLIACTIIAPATHRTPITSSTYMAIRPLTFFRHARSIPSLLAVVRTAIDKALLHSPVDQRDSHLPILRTKNTARQIASILERISNSPTAP